MVKQPLGWCHQDDALQPLSSTDLVLGANSESSSEAVAPLLGGQAARLNLHLHLHGASSTHEVSLIPPKHKEDPTDVVAQPQSWYKAMELPSIS